MADITDEQIAKERAAVEAMKNARANMDASLNRIRTLENTLADARRSISHYKTYVPSAAYSYGGQKKLHDVMDECVADITKVLGSVA